MHLRFPVQRREQGDGGRAVASLRESVSDLQRHGLVLIRSIASAMDTDRPSTFARSNRPIEPVPRSPRSRAILLPAASSMQTVQTFSFNAS